MRSENYINEVRQANLQLWNAIGTLLDHQREWNALDYGNTLSDGAIGGQNDGITKAQIGSVVFDTANALKAVLDAGSATNMARLL